MRSLIFIVVCYLSFAQANDWHDYMLVSAFASQENQYKLLTTLEENKLIHLWNEIHRNSDVQLMLNRFNASNILSLLESVGLKPHIQIPDVQKLFDDERQRLETNARSATTRGIRDTFYNYDDMSAWLLTMTQTYPNLAVLQSIGKTAENRDIWLIKLTSPNGAQKKTAFLDFGIHAREWISPATGAYMIDELLSQYGKNAQLTAILDSWELHIVPILNPDGYQYSHTSDRMWRKNRVKNAGNCFGVDLNRNFGYKFNTGGSSGVACSDTYHGGAAMNQNEAKAMESYMTPRKWTTYLTFHSYGQYWFTNWGYTSVLPTNYNALKQKADVGANAIAAVNGRRYSVGSSAVLLYVASGGSEDWTAGVLNITNSFCLELPPIGGSGFVVPTSEIPKTGDETLKGVVAYLNTF